MLDELGGFCFTGCYFGRGSAGSRGWQFGVGVSQQPWRRCDSLEGSKFSSENNDCSYPASEWAVDLPGRQVRWNPSLGKTKQNQPLFPVRKNHLLFLRLLREAPFPASLFLLCESGLERSGEWNTWCLIAEAVLWLHVWCDVTSPGAGRGEAEACCGESGWRLCCLHWERNRWGYEFDFS